MSGRHALLVLLAIAPLGCADEQGSEALEIELVVMHGHRFDTPGVTYELRDESNEILQEGEIPLVSSGGSVPPGQLWALATTLPIAGRYGLSLTASTVDAGSCTGAIDFTIPPDELAVLLDCRENPMRPGPDQIAEPIIYVVGRRQLP